MEISNKQKIFNAKQILKEMLIDRGYPESELTPLSKDFKNTKYETDIYWEIINKNGKEKTLISFFINKKLDSKLVESHFTKAKTLYDNQISEVKIIMISDTSLTNPTIAKNNDYMKNSGIYSQIYLVDDLQFNITKSNLVPKHELLTKEEIDNLPFEVKNLPKILSTDPVSRYYAVNKKNVFKITTISETTGESISYNEVI